MGVREALDQKKSLVVSVAIAVIVIAPVWAFIYFRPQTALTPDSSALQAFFTDDDGATTFQDDATKIPPFDHHGKEAVRAYLFSSKGKQFVGYLERYSKDAQMKLAGMKSDINHALEMQRARNSIVPDVKKPGDTVWVLRNSPMGQKIIDVSAPDGTKSDVEPVLP